MLGVWSLLFLKIIQIDSLYEVLNDLIIIRSILGRLNRLLKCLSDFIVTVTAVNQMLLEVPERFRVLALVDHLFLYSCRWRDISMHL